MDAYLKTIIDSSLLAASSLVVSVNLNKPNLTEKQNNLKSADPKIIKPNRKNNLQIKQIRLSHKNLKIPSALIPSIFAFGKN